MSQEHAATLLNLTGDLFPSGATLPEQLSELRVILLTALRGGETPADIGLREFAGAPVNGAAEEIAALGDADPPPPSLNRVARRSAAIRAADQVIGGPAWTLAQAPGRRLGPFQDGGGALHWFDVYTPANTFFIRSQGVAGPIALLPAGTVRNADGTLTVPAGNLWLDGPSIHASAPAGSWAGLRIIDGTVTLSGPVLVTAAGALLRAQAGTGATLHITLDTQEVVGFPDKITIGASAGGIRIFDLVPGFFTAFGNKIEVNPPNVLPTVSGYDPVLRSLIFPLTPDPRIFAPVQEGNGGLFPMSGSAAIQSATWTIPVTVEVFDALADAEGPGAFAITVQGGLEVALPGTAGGNIALHQSTILVTPGCATVFSPAAANSGATQTLAAWFEDRSQQRSSLELTREAPFASWFFQLDTGEQAVVTRALAALQIDRPLRASGERLGTRYLALHLLEQDEAGSRMALRGRLRNGDPGLHALALANALLTVSEPFALELNAVLNGPNEMQSGAIHLAFALAQLLPALPDPYAANFDPKVNLAQFPSILVNATVIWTEPFDAHLDIMLSPPPFNMQALGTVLPDFPALLVDEELPDAFDSLGKQRIDRGLALLDVSSNAGQFGMALGVGDQPGGGLSIRELTLNVAGSNAMVFLLPQFHCEPVFNKANPHVLGESEGTLFYVDDGGPTLAAADTVRLVQVRPIALLAEVVQSYMQDRHDAGVRFNLPFGIAAVAQLNPLDPQFGVLPQLQIVAPRFANFDGAPQLSLIAGVPVNRASQAWIAGQTVQRNSGANGPPFNTMGAVVGLAFNTAFEKGVPIDRIGLSGYGANIFSRWSLDAPDPDIGITQVAFDAINGRTSYERVMLTSYLLPCFARVVRTITLERYGNGGIVRWDSGWLATTPGRFTHQGYVFHKGAILGALNIREISDTDYTVKLNDGSVLQAVYYDSDIQVDGAIRGSDSNGRVPARRHLGFVQQLTIPAAPGPGPVTAKVIDNVRMNELLKTQGRLGGPIDCQISVGSSPHEMKISGLFVENATNNEFALALYGAPSLQAAGQWSVVKTNNTTHQTEPVDPAVGIPLVKANFGPFRWADPADLLLPNPASDYGFLFSSRMQRILFARPKIEERATTITGGLPPLLADPYSLLKAPGLFPAANQAIPFDLPNWALESAAGKLQLTPTPFPVTVVKTGFDLVQASDWGSKLSYVDADGGATKFFIDSAVDWVIHATGVEQVLTFPVVGTVMRVVHGIAAPALGDGSFPDAKFLFNDALSAVADVLDMLKTWAPNLPGGLHVEPSFSGSTFRLNAVADFDITDSEGNAIDCGMGKLKGELKLGADLSVEIANRTVNGSIFFEVTGSWQQLVFPFIYGGGLMRFSVGADLSGSTTLELDAAVTGSVGGDIIPFLVSLEATVRYGYFLATNPIAPGFLVGIEGRAKLLSGLLGFKLSIDGRISVARIHGDPNNLCTLHGEILVAGTVTVCWLVDERKSFRTHYDVQVGWELALILAKTAILPVP